MKVILIIFFLAPLVTHAGSEDDADCSAYYGLNVCDSTDGIGDENIDYSRQNKFSFDTKAAGHDSLFGTMLTDDSMGELDTEDVFKNIDSFRAYMKTIEDSDYEGIDDEFSVKKRLFDSTDIGLDCRIVAESIYELSNSQYYDCALQRYF